MSQDARDALWTGHSQNALTHIAEGYKLQGEDFWDRVLRTDEDPMDVCVPVLLVGIGQ